MKKVLMVSCEGLGRGGVQAVMMGIIRSLHDSYHFDMMLFTNEVRYYDKEFLSYGGKIIRIPRYAGKNKLLRKSDYYTRGFSLYHKVKNALIENGPYDVVHCNNEFESAIVLKAAAAVNIPIRIAHTHVISSKGNLVYNCLNGYRKRIIEKFSTLKLGCSENACRSFYWKPNTSYVLNNPYDDKIFTPIISNNLNNTKLRLIQVGAFCHNKNQFFTLDVFQNILKTFPDSELHLVGFPMGISEDELQCRCNYLGIEQSVFIHKSDEDIPRLLFNSTAMIHPSIAEGFGIVIIEAQAMGVKCFASDRVPKATDCGGITFLSLNQGPEVWAEKIMEHYQQEHGAHHNYDCSKFAQENIMKQIDGIYSGKTNM